MTLSRARALPLIGAGCLVGQGVILGLTAGGAGSPGLAVRGLFLLLTLLVAVSLSFCDLPASRSLTRRLWRGLTLAGVSALLALAVWWLAADVAAPAAVDGFPHAERQLAAAEATLGRLDASLQSVASAVLARGPVPGGGDLVRMLDAWPDRWARQDEGGKGLPLALLVWTGGERVAWSRGARPLGALDAPPDSAAVVVERADLLYRRLFRHGAAVLEAQVTLGGPAWRAAWPAVTVAGPDRAAPNARQAGLGAGDDGPRVALSVAAQVRQAGLQPAGARRMVMLLGAWILVAAGFARVCGRGLAWLLPLWLGRGLLAAVEAHRWLAAAWPSEDHPARPGSLASLVDPAYFATPFLGGWFASAADALLTAALLALSVWQIVQRAGPAASTATRGRGLLAGLGFGLGAGGLLLALRGLATLLAVNANARLVGQGVSLSYLSFWVLHATLMLLSLSMAVLAVRAVAGGGWPDRRRRTVWVGGGLLAAAVAALLLVAAGVPSPRLPALAALLVAALWAVAPGLGQRTGLRRRLVWPAVMILATCWNHGALRQVYAASERGWLQGKAQVIGEADTAWRRFLLGEVLEDIWNLDQLQARPSGPADVWRQEPAWALWRGSALRDLGVPSLVEILDTDNISLALHATGFMRDFNYEVADRGDWEGADGEYGSEDPDIYFRTERRLYAGGEEEILAGEIARRGGRGWIHVEIPLRSWRISTLLAELNGDLESDPGRYRPRSEVDRPLLLLHADQGGWLDAGDSGFPAAGSEPLMAALRSGEREWAELEVDGRRWLCLWKALPPAAQRTPGEGFVLGLARPGLSAELLDLSRLLLLNLTLLLLAAATVQIVRAVERRLGDDTAVGPWRAGFQERFLAGYLVLGFVLLVLVGTSVDRVTHERIAGEAGGGPARAWCRRWTSCAIC